MTEKTLTLQEQVVAVARLRNTERSLALAIGLAREAWEDRNRVEIDNYNAVLAAKNLAEEALRARAVEEYNLTGKKKPAPGIEIKVFTRLSYEPPAALAWAIDHKLALQLNKASFDKIAKDNPMDFVALTQEARALIATDLAKALGEVKF